ncbi:MAG: hypothetical protein MUP11_09495, partial [Anaerolineales bacterium]|nr:hypothetical protein [Anaerolineales bacterium]
MPDENNGTLYPENQDPDNQDNNIPDWMKEAGWDNSSGTVDESKPIFDDLDDDEELVPADIPAWLEDAAPEGFNFDEEIPGVDKGAAEETTRAFIDDDLTSTIADNQLPALESEPTPPSSAGSAKITKEDPGFDIPSWLENLEMDEDSQETAVAWLENMPESLRATKEEKAAALKPKIETLEPPVDELDWIDDPSVKTEFPQYTDEPAEEEKISTAALSENLVASELIPESTEDDQIFDQDEIKSMERDIPSWLQELNNEADLSPDVAPIDKPETLDLDFSSVADFETQEQEQDSSKNHVTHPDWLSEFEVEEEKPDQLSTKPEPIVEQVDQGGIEIPDWLSDFESSAASEQEEKSSSLDWLDDLAGKVTQPEAESASPLEQYVNDEPLIPASAPVTAEESQGDDPSNDDTLNTQIPDWLSKIGEGESVEESKESPAQTDFEESAAWLDQIDDPISTEAEQGGPLPDNDLADWLDKKVDQPDELSSEQDIRESLTGELETESDQKPIELETAKYYIEEKEPTESLPDWLSDLASEDIDQPTTLESAIRKSEHTLSEDELTFLNQAEETQDDNADWLAKLDLVDDQPSSESGPPAISVDSKVDVVSDEKEKIEESG